MARNENNKQGVFLGPPKQDLTVVIPNGYVTVVDGSRPLATFPASTGERATTRETIKNR